MQRPFGKLEEVESDFNGKIQVLGSVEGPRVFVDGVLQSGRLMKSVWNTGIKKAKTILPEANTVLILGLGAGSACEVVKKYYPDAKITGLDIDPQMVAVGKKYLKLDNINGLEIFVSDAYKWVGRDKNKYDLILIDLFHGERIPEKFYEEKFLVNTAKLLNKNGLIAFNHLFAYSDRKDAALLSKVLRKVFTKITTVTPEANIIYLVQKD